MQYGGHNNATFAQGLTHRNLLHQKRQWMIAKLNAWKLLARIDRCIQSFVGSFPAGPFTVAACGSRTSEVEIIVLLENNLDSTALLRKRTGVKFHTFPHSPD